MRILITAAGSRGDVVPYTGLGARLRAAGHEVALATHEAYADAVRAAGLEHRPLPSDPRTAVPGGDSGAAPGKRALMARAAAFLEELGDGLADAAAPGADLMLLSATTAPLGRQLAEAAGTPSLGVSLQPAHPTRAFPPPLGGGRSLGPWGNRLAGAAALKVVDRLYAGPVRALRARLGLPPASAAAVRRRGERAGWPVLYGVSPVLVPRPDDWRAGLEVTGTWWPYRAPEEGLPAAVEDFLAAGPPPVFVGFGSMASGEGARLAEVTVRALRRAGVRGILQAGWAGLVADGAADDVLSVGELPHALLFPRTAAVVHHCGAGTTAAGLRAGVPTVPVPVTADQPFWAARLTALGAATAPVPFARLAGPDAVDRLAAAVGTAVRDAGLRGRAREAAGRLAAEDGAARVVRAVERIADGGPARAAALG
ncbi:UDP-glucose--sterol glucosyltransferase [Streptomyces sp. Ru73]|uniref:glycosyltransferase n=1 Tax=Streptomyces sp. Ru73 TaxID=2080748 RepID=UPI000CDDEC52|nr:glycosyltransferase [Streptomyces sp. Ru73]POX41544.1 UDP-glucose--sterol glucosyltransferase [Streptomyces sp. Ru73]